MDFEYKNSRVAKYLMIFRRPGYLLETLQAFRPTLTDGLVLSCITLLRSKLSHVARVDINSQEYIINNDWYLMVDNSIQVCFSSELRAYKLYPLIRINKLDIPGFQGLYDYIIIYRWSLL